MKILCLLLPSLLAETVPKGWGPPPRDIPGFDPDSCAVNLRDKDRFADNVNVILSPAGEMTPEQAEGNAPKELTTAGAKNVSIGDRVTVAGSESAHLTGVMALNNNRYTIEQFSPTDDGQTFVVTFGFSRSVPAADRAKVTEAVLTSWAWAD